MVRSKRANRVQLLVFIAPAVVIYSIFLALPLLDSLRLSLYSTQPDGSHAFVGLDNFQQLFSNPLYSVRFWAALKNTFVFMGVFLLIQNPFSLFLATLLSSRSLRGAAIYRTIIFIPTTLSIVIAGWIWSLMLNPMWGIVNDLLHSAGLESIIPSEGWQGSPDYALLVVAAVGAWQFLGMPMILYLAALLNIDDELLDAARVDGATNWRLFWHVKLPLVLPVAGVVSILMFISNFTAFDHVYVMQGPLSAPNYETDILGTFFHRVTFGTSAVVANPSMGTTIATVMFFIIFVVVASYLFLIQPRLNRVS